MRPPPDRVLTMDEIRSLPPGSAADVAPGIYFLLLAGEVVYVGMSGDVNGRIYSHRCERRFRGGSKRWDEERIYHCSRTGLEEAEVAHIRHYSPRFNVKDVP